MAYNDFECHQVNFRCLHLSHLEPSKKSCVDRCHSVRIREAEQHDQNPNKILT